MIAALAIVSVLLALSVVVNVIVISGARQLEQNARAVIRSAELLARHDRSPSGKLWPPRRDGAA